MFDLKRYDLYLINSIIFSKTMVIKCQKPIDRITFSASEQCFLIGTVLILSRSDLIVVTYLIEGDKLSGENESMSRMKCFQYLIDFKFRESD